MRVVLRVTVAVVAFMVGFGSTVAFADVSQDGRRTDSTSVDGTTAGVIGNTFSPRSGQCVLYSILGVMQP